MINKEKVRRIASKNKLPKYADGVSNMQKLQPGLLVPKNYTVKKSKLPKYDNDVVESIDPNTEKWSQGMSSKYIDPMSASQSGISNSTLGGIGSIASGIGGLMKTPDANSPINYAGDILGDAGKGASMGAALGPWGAGAGALVGGIYGAVDASHAALMQQRQQTQEEINKNLMNNNSMSNQVNANYNLRNSTNDRVPGLAKGAAMFKSNQINPNQPNAMIAKQEGVADGQTGRVGVVPGKYDKGNPDTVPANLTEGSSVFSKNANQTIPGGKSTPADVIARAVQVQKQNDKILNPKPGDRKPSRIDELTAKLNQRNIQNQVSNLNKYNTLVNPQQNGGQQPGIQQNPGMQQQPPQNTQQPDQSQDINQTNQPTGIIPLNIPETSAPATLPLPSFDGGIGGTVRSYWTTDSNGKRVPASLMNLTPDQKSSLKYTDAPWTGVNAPSKNSWSEYMPKESNNYAISSNGVKEAYTDPTNPTAGIGYIGGGVNTDPNNGIVKPSRQIINGKLVNSNQTNTVNTSNEINNSIPNQQISTNQPIPFNPNASANSNNAYNRISDKLNSNVSAINNNISSGNNLANPNPSGDYISPALNTSIPSGIQNQFKVPSLGIRTTSGTADNGYLNNTGATMPSTPILSPSKQSYTNSNINAPSLQNNGSMDDSTGVLKSDADASTQYSPYTAPQYTIPRSSISNNYNTSINNNQSSTAIPTGSTQAASVLGDNSLGKRLTSLGNSAMSLAPMAYNAWNATPEVASPMYNNFINPNQRYNIAPELAESTKQRQISRYGNANINTSTGANMAYGADQYSRGQEQLSGLMGKAQMANNQYREQYANNYNQQNSADTAENRRIYDVNARNRAAARTFGAANANMLSQYGQTQQLMGNQKQADLLNSNIWGAYANNSMTPENIARINKLIDNR